MVWALDLNLSSSEDLTEKGRCNPKAEGNVCLVTGADRNRANEKGTTMNATDMTPKTTYTVTLNDGTSFTGLFISITSKGASFKVGDVVIVRSLRRITDITDPMAIPNTPADLFVDGVTYTAAAVAAALDMDSYDLRVQLRALGMGVGKGRKYGFDAADARTVFNAVKAGQATA